MAKGTTDLVSKDLELVIKTKGRRNATNNAHLRSSSGNSKKNFEREDDSKLNTPRKRELPAQHPRL